jgi:hypothetical protein
MTIETSASIENLATALGKFQAETHGVVRDAVNPFHKNRYATLEAVIETARPGLAKAGLAFLQAPSGFGQGAVEITTILMHGSSGEWIRASYPMPLPKPDPQGVGSAITYGCRYALMAMLGLPPLDDDAEATKPQPNQWDKATKPQQSASPVQDSVKRTSKDVYIANSLKRIDSFNSAADLLNWAKTERKMVWPQYGADFENSDGRIIVGAYKERMAVLTDDTDAEVSE